MEEIDRACDLLEIETEDHSDFQFMSDDSLLEFFEETPLYSEIPLIVFNECLYRYSKTVNLNEEILDENAIMGALSAIGNGLLAAGGAFTSVLTGPYGMLVTSLGLTAAAAIFRKIKRAAEKKDRDAVQAEIAKAQAEIAAAQQNKNGGQQVTQTNIAPPVSNQQPVQQQKA